MHSCCATEVRFAGEFVVLLDKDLYKLVIDNNSGTYAPPREGLAPTKAIFEANFPGLRVETVHWQDKELNENKAYVNRQHELIRGKSLSGSSGSSGKR